MMNRMPPGHYLPVMAKVDPALHLLFLAPSLESQVRRAYHSFDQLLAQPIDSKIETFMNQSPPEGKIEAEIRALQAEPLSGEWLGSENAYHGWLAEKAILRTERFFPNHPSWNVGSTRHALMGDFQFKGLGLTSPVARVDYHHISGHLHLYVALYETLMSWHLDQTPVGAQKIAALWVHPQWHSLEAQSLMLREAKSLRLAQFVGLKLRKSERERIWSSMGVQEVSQLEARLRDILSRYAWFYAHSYEILAPTSDNLVLDGTLLDFGGVVVLAGDQARSVFRLRETGDGKFYAGLSVTGQIADLLENFSEAFGSLGCELSLAEVEEIFWHELARLLPDAASVLRVLSPLWAELRRSGQPYTLMEWQALLQSVSPSPIDVSVEKKERSRFLRDEPLTSLEIRWQGEGSSFDPYIRTDRMVTLLRGHETPESDGFTRALLQQAQA